MPNYNIKRFLVPDSPRSMSCFHAKVMDDNMMKLTIHDCKRSIQFKNDLTDPDQIAEAIEKLTCLTEGIIGLIEFIKINYAEQRTYTLKRSEVEFGSTVFDNSSY